MIAFNIINRKQFNLSRAQCSENAADLLHVSRFLESITKDQAMDYQQIRDSRLQKACREISQLIEKRFQERSAANWEAEGVDRLLKLLRLATNKRTNELCNDCITFLVKYVGANQGGIFLYDNTDRADEHLVLTGMYAYERLKHSALRVDIGQGLIGECFADGKPIYMTNVPQNYVRITSGLGEATASTILLTAMVSNEVKVGVIELAFFKDLPLHERKFVEKVSESIAGIILRKKESEQMEQLLVNSKVLSEKLEDREKFLQQKLEELNTAQSELTMQYEALNKVRLELEEKNMELEAQKKREAELLASQLETHDALHQRVIERLKSKIKALEENVQSNVLAMHHQ